MSIASSRDKKIVKKNLCKHEKDIRLYSLVGERSASRLNRDQHDPVAPLIVGKN
jgi:hypothetical protein